MKLRIKYTTPLVPLLKTGGEFFGKIFLILVFTIFLTYCKKDDITKNVTFHGNVRNDCTGYGFAGVKVELITYKLEKKVFALTSTEKRNIISTTTDANGNYSFSGVEIHSSSKYTYGINIPSYYNDSTELVGISWEIHKDNLSLFQQFGITATFNRCYIYLPANTYIVSPDTFTVTLEQKAIKRYEPGLNCKLTLPYNLFFPDNGIVMPDVQYFYCCGDYVMGWWHITLDKTKRGVHSVIEDSIYLDQGATKSYTLQW